MHEISGTNYLPKITMKRYFLTFLYLLIAHLSFAQFKISGKVLQAESKKPVAYAVVSIADKSIWTIADQEGKFQLNAVQQGHYTLQINYLGFATGYFPLILDKDQVDLTFALKADDLKLEAVTVTAQRTSEPGTSYLIDQKALEHLQMLNATDVSSLLPGGKTNKQNHLASGAQQFAINGVSTEMGNALFGVGVEVDGQRLSNNALSGDMTGIDTRNIASSNIESIEVITGVPSVEIGDATNGVVKINTRKGKSKYLLELVTKPNTKQVALSKGFDIGMGVINVNFEHTKSISDLASPYTSYTRNGISLFYTHTFFKKTNPLSVEYGVTGNMGGSNTKSDPDRFVNTYSKTHDRVFRSNLALKWLLNKSWITNLEASGGVHFNNNTSEISTNQSSSSSVVALHAMNQGYYVGQTYAENPNADLILVEPGYWYQVKFDESKAINYNAKLKANHSFSTGRLDHNLKVGLEYAGSHNNGQGTYYDNLRYAPTWRPYPYRDVPAQNNLAVYLEDKIRVQIFNRDLQLTAGVRSDNTFIDGTEYTKVKNISPRMNLQYDLLKSRNQDLKYIRIKAGWGKTVKLPAFTTLFPQQSYRDILTFTPGTTSDGKTYYAYFTQPNLPIFNPDLKWQSNIQKEIGLQANYKGHRISITFAHDQTSHSYTTSNVYTPFTYKFTGQQHLENVNIPYPDRQYTVDQQTGVVTVSDKTGNNPSEALSYREITRFYSNSKPINGPSPTRNRLSWIIDFKKIDALKTSFRVDGNYYTYKGLEETIQAYMPNSTINMADGNPYKYIGFFAGGNGLANGKMTKSVDMNVTAITHIPSLKMIMSLRVEGSLYSASQNLSQYQNAQRGVPIDSRDASIPSETMQDIYGGNRFVAIYPVYYTSLDDLTTQIPFQEKLIWAKNNDPALYNELTKLVVRTTDDYYFTPNRVSAYYSANLGITKEIGNFASITFNATNFLNNMGQVKSSATGNSSSLFGSRFIPTFYYGISFKLKI